jgi:hypothetical protein
MITISMISTAAARNVVVKTAGLIMATSLPTVKARAGLEPRAAAVVGWPF